MNLNAVPFTQVSIRDSFWSPRREANRKVSVPHSFEMLDASGNLRNLELAAQGAREGFSNLVFADSDVYKVLEAASYVLAEDRDPELEERVDVLIAKVAAAQRPDGYLNSYYQINGLEKRWTNLRDNHELYCAGHLFEAAVAHYQATGKRSLLDVACRFADHIDSTFGEGPGKRPGYPGHPEIELALVKLWKVTGQRRYFDLARYFVESRGTGFFAREHSTPADRYDGAYWQDNVSIREHRAIVGHAVRAAYLLAGVVDVARETGDEGLLAMVDRVWRNTTGRRMYVTGGIGPSAHNEGFTTDFDLPNLTAYQETCASVALAMWAQRLALLYGDARYADAMETALYNGFLAGVSLDGRRFFYVNPLASKGNHHRSEWFGCACCPPNVTRTLASLGGYAWAASDRGLWANLYIQGSLRTEVGGRPVEVETATDYPWDGRVTLTLKPEAPIAFALRLRVPGWCSRVAARLNSEPLTSPRMERGYLVLEREWRPGDRVELELDMPVRRVAADPRVKGNAGRLALARGPLIYCLEGVDHTVPVSALALPPDAPLEAHRRPELLGGAVALEGEGLARAEPEWPGGLYATAKPPRRVPVRAVPYYAWDNREPGEMAVWIPTAVAPPAILTPEQRAKVTVSFANSNSQPEGIHDGLEPKSSGEHPPLLCHWWPHKGGEEWAQYTWDRPITAIGARVYWFDDTGRGECRLPASWRVEYRNGEEWKPVAAEGDYPVKQDGWCEVRFAPVTTTALRLVVAMQPQWAAGLHEWQVLTPEE